MGIGDGGGLALGERDEPGLAGCFVGVLEDMAQSWHCLMAVQYQMQVEIVVPAFHAGHTSTGLDVERVSKDRKLSTCKENF